MERFLFTILGLMLVVESLALLFGVVLSESGVGEGDAAQVGVAWSSPRNILFLGLDALTGFLLLLFVLGLGPRMSPLVVVGMLGVALITHSVREVEFWVGTAGAFCYNRPLEVLNFLKLALISLVLFLGDGE